MWCPFSLWHRHFQKSFFFRRRSDQLVNDKNHCTNKCQIYVSNLTVSCRLSKCSRPSKRNPWLPFIRNLYWDGQIAKKLSGTQATEVKKLIIFFFIFYHNFEDTVTNFHKDLLRKETLKWNNNHIKKCRYLFSTTEQLRNFEYSKLQKAKKLWVLRPDLSFLCMAD